ncbi:MAG TPA: aminotransferase class V-fold PLP-dependent enzyme, partial [Pirellulaceae bacterium]|nr:aminotransferase class V-fold PLP-dependent enzyme [Pirellulaceae bacterium]
PLDDDDVERALLDAYRDGSWGRYDGPNSRRLLGLLADLVEVEHVHLCSSGTIAVELALRGVGVGPGDEVVLAGYDFPGNFRAIEAVGARPVLVDIDAATWCLDVEQFSAAVGPQTKAVIASHLHGGLVAMRRLRSLADQAGVTVVEDACQCPGASVGGRPAGAWGDVGVFSFGGSKLLTSGRGGALFTRRADVAQRIKVAVDRGNDAYPLSELQAAVLAPQVIKLGERNRLRRRRVNELVGLAREWTCLRPLTPQSELGEPAYYKLAWLYDPAAANGRSREELIRRLQADSLPLDAGFRGFVGRSSNRCRKVGDLTNSRRAAIDTIVLHHPLLLADSQTYRECVERLVRVMSEWHDSRR